MPLTIYGVTRSRALRNLWMAEELGIPYQQLHIAQQDAASHPDVPTLNPMARLPTIDDAGFGLFESLAINLYLAKKHGGPLAPRNLQEDALMTAWTLVANGDCEGPATEVIMHRLVYPPPLRRTAKVKAAFVQLRKPLDRIEAHLARHPYLVGDRFTVADVNVASVLSWLLVEPARLQAWPKICAWLAVITQRPQLRKFQT